MPAMLKRRLLEPRTRICATRSSRASAIRSRTRPN